MQIQKKRVLEVCHSKHSRYYVCRLLYWSTVKINYEGQPAAICVGDTYDNTTILRYCNNDNALQV